MYSKGDYGLLVKGDLREIKTRKFTNLDKE
jgi:hypothetical protein